MSSHQSVSVFYLLLSVVLFYMVNCHDPRYQTTRQEQCPVMKQEIEYIDKGREFMLSNNLKIYETDDRTPRRLLVFIVFMIVSDIDWYRY